MTGEPYADMVHMRTTAIRALDAFPGQTISDRALAACELAHKAQPRVPRDPTNPEGLQMGGTLVLLWIAMIASAIGIVAGLVALALMSL